MSSRIRTTLATLALAVLANACLPDLAVAPQQIDTLDAALAEVAIPAMTYASATFSGAGVVTPMISPARCRFDEGSRTFVCGQLAGGGLTLDQNFTLLDGVGEKQAAYDMKTTSSLIVRSAVAGTALRDGTKLTVDGQQELALSDLGTPQHTLNGSSVTVAIVDSPSQLPITSTITTRITNLVIPVVPITEPAPWPASGMIELRTTTDLGLVIPLDASGVTVSTAALNFNGSSIVSLTIVDKNGTRTCRVNIVIEPLGCSAD
jgi:hypothetical protein